MVIPDTYNDVFIETTPVSNLIASHVPLLVFNIMLCIEGDAMVLKSCNGFVVIPSSLAILLGYAFDRLLLNLLTTFQIALDITNLSIEHFHPISLHAQLSQ
jgi:hypothetical protein